MKVFWSRANRNCTHALLKLIYTFNILYSLYKILVYGIRRRLSFVSNTSNGVFTVGGIQLVKVFLGCQVHTIPSYNTKGWGDGNS